MISGTPVNGDVSGQSTIQVSDAEAPNPQVAQVTTSIVVAAPVQFQTTSLASASVGAELDDPIVLDGGLAPYTFAVTSGTLPTGVTLDTEGELVGTPTVAGTSTFTITATDGSVPVAQSASETLILPVAPAPPVQSNLTEAPVGLVGVPYYDELTATGGVGPYSWVITSGSLPDGLALDPNGAITGTPTTIETASFKTPGIRRTAGSFDVDRVRVDPHCAGHAAHHGVHGRAGGRGGCDVSTDSARRLRRGGAVHLVRRCRCTARRHVARRHRRRDLRNADRGRHLRRHSRSHRRRDGAGDGDPGAHPRCGTSGDVHLDKYIVNGRPQRRAGYLHGHRCGAGHAARAVIFLDGGVTIGSCDNVGLSGASPYIATCTVSYGDAGGHSVSAHYLGDGSTLPSDSSTILVTSTVIPPTIVTSSVPNGTVESEYPATTLESTDGVAPEMWSVSSGALPPGLTLDAGSGTLSGTPTMAGSFGFTVAVTDSETSPATASQAFTIVITPAATSVQLSASVAELVAGQVETYTATINSPVMPTGAVAFDDGIDPVGGCAAGGSIADDAIHGHLHCHLRRDRFPLRDCLVLG